MANYQQLKTAIQTAINNNGQGAITGQVLQDVLKDIVDVVGEGYTFVGLATTSTVPSVDDSKVFYLASQVGTYSNFGGIVVGEGLTVLKYDTAWSAVQVLSFDFIDEKLDTYIAQAQSEIDAAISELGDVSNADVNALKELLVNNGLAYKITQNKEHSTSSNDTTIVAPNAAFSATYVANEGSVIYGATVMMGNTDISSTAITHINNNVCWVSISSVTDNVTITIIATKPIVFEDPAVKTICVENWGGNYIEGEITEHEASVVTSFNDVFKSNLDITYFNEFRYFTGVTLSSRPLVGGYAAGEFYNAENLLEITLPPLTGELANMAGIVRSAGKLRYLDLTPLKAKSVTVSNLCRETPITYLSFPNSCKITNDAYYMCRACSKLTTINFNNTDWSAITTYSNAFYNCVGLTTITGNPIGFKAGLNFINSGNLTKESIMVIINGLYDFVGNGSATTMTLRLHSSTLAKLSEDDIAIGTDKGWAITT